VAGACASGCSLGSNLLLRPGELGPIDPQAVHDDRELSRDGDTGK